MTSYGASDLGPRPQSLASTSTPGFPGKGSDLKWTVRIGNLKVPLVSTLEMCAGGRRGQECLQVGTEESLQMGPRVSQTPRGILMLTEV